MTSYSRIRRPWEALPVLLLASSARVVPITSDLPITSHKLVNAAPSAPVLVVELPGATVGLEQIDIEICQSESKRGREGLPYHCVS